MLRGGAETWRLKTIGEALRETMALFVPLPPSPYAGTFGQFVAEPITAVIESPPFDASLVDGYAVRASEITQGASLSVHGESRAGSAMPSALAVGTAMRIFTGAPVPQGSDAVVMQEVVARDGTTARFERPVQVGASIRRRGSDIGIGQTLLDRGALIDTGAVGLLATQGWAGGNVRAHARPRVVIVTTGDELLPLHEPLRPGAIYDSNEPMLGAMIGDAGARYLWHRRAPDDLDETVSALALALASGDVVLTVGGVSVGDHDLVHAALASLGVERRLSSVRMKPGRPLAVGVKDGTPVIGLPGNPVSAWVGFEVFVRPGLRRMLGDPRPHRRVVDLTLGRATRTSADRTELARARIDDDGVAWPFTKQGSSALTSVTGVDALLILPEREGEVAAGEKVRALLLDGRGSAQPPFV